MKDQDSSNTQAQGEGSNNKRQLTRPIPTDAFDGYLPLRPVRVAAGEYEIRTRGMHVLAEVEGSAVAEWLCGKVNSQTALYEAASKAANELSVMLALNPARDGGLYREALDALNAALSLAKGEVNQSAKPQHSD